MPGVDNDERHLKLRAHLLNITHVASESIGFHEESGGITDFRIKGLQCTYTSTYKS